MKENTNVDGTARVVIVGAGPANPFNGGGVSLGMESGLMAAEVAAEVAAEGLADSDMSVGRRLRERYLSPALFPECATGTFESDAELDHRESPEAAPSGSTARRCSAGRVVDPREAVSWRTLRDVVR